MSQRRMDADYDTVIVGAGQAGVHVAQSLHRQGYAGTVALLSEDNRLPYQRPPLSKSYLRGEEKIDNFVFRSEDFWMDAGIGLRLGEAVTFVDPDARSVRTAAGRTYGYSNLVWAAGGSARRLEIPGAELSGVLTLRTLDDADRIIAFKGLARAAVIIGGGFIGLEVAASLSAAGIRVTVIEAQDRLLARVAGEEVSTFYRRLHIGHGVDVRVSSGVAAFCGTEEVERVLLTDGESIPADLVLVGVGLTPNIEPLRRAGVRCSDGIDTDASGRSSDPRILAAGDCANREHPFANGRRVRLESVPNAIEHAKTIAATILGQPSPRVAAPWFWSHQYDSKLQTVGLAAGHDETVLRGDPAAGSFSLLYLRRGRIVALDCVNSTRDFAQGRVLVEGRAVVAGSKRLADSTTPLKMISETSPQTA